MKNTLTATITWPVIFIISCVLSDGTDVFAGQNPRLPSTAESPVAQTSSITLEPGEHLKVSKVMPLDGRLVRGFAHGPIDGRTDTRYYNGVVSEWSGVHGGGAIRYRAFNGNNGLHITLPEGGVDAVFLRGEWAGNLFANLPGLGVPAEAEPLCEVQPTNGVFIRRFVDRLHARRLSFFYESDDLQRTLQEVAFLRLGKTFPPSESRDEEFLRPASGSPPDEYVRRAMAVRYGKDPGGHPAVHRLAESGNGHLRLTTHHPLQLVTPPQDPALGLEAVTIRFRVPHLSQDLDLTLHVQDVLDPRRDVMSVDLRLGREGHYAVTLDHPDQVYLPASEQGSTPRYNPAPHRNASTAPAIAWLSVSASAAVDLRDVTIALHHTPRSQALPEAADWRLRLLKGLFQSTSEPRPWMHLKNTGPIAAQVDSSKAIQRHRASLVEVLETAEIARRLLPASDTVRQYYDWIYQNVDRHAPHPTNLLPDVPEAPRWAVQVREGWRNMSHIARWWLDNRLVATGELGGGINDDTDMFQTWQFLPMIESSPLGDRLKDAAARLSQTAVEHTLEDGLNRRTTDALHAYEEGVNQLALCAWWFYGDPVHFERAMAAARSVGKLMVETEDGRVHFGGRSFGIHEAREGFTELGRSPGNANWAPARFMLHPLYVVGLYNRNPTALDKFERWGRTWRKYQSPGRFVGQVDILSGEPTVVSERPTAEAVGPVNEWLALYQMTGDPEWQEPFTFTMAAGGYWGTHAKYGRMPHALLEWPEAAQTAMRQRLTRPEDGYAAFFLHKDRRYLEYWLDASASWFGWFPHMDTAAEQQTDRVLSYKASVPISCYLGDAPNRNRFLNFTAVSYEGLQGDDFAALVWDAGPDVLKVAIYNFRDAALQGRMRVWRLDHGRYRVRTGPDADDDGHMDEVSGERTMELQRYAAVTLTLPPKQVTIVEVKQVEQLGDLRSRADLALSPLDTYLGPEGEIDVKVHNIGALPARDITVSLVRGGTVVASHVIEHIEDPHDLLPRIATVHFSDAQDRDTVIVDPEETIPEIAEHNNRLVLGSR
jgi:hypothetical protein